MVSLYIKGFPGILKDFLVYQRVSFNIRGRGARTWKVHESSRGGTLMPIRELPGEFEGWNSHVRRELPGKFGSSNLSRDDLSREPGPGPGRGAFQQSGAVAETRRGFLSTSK